MNLVRRNESQVVIRQIPLLLLGVTALFSLPFLAFSLFHLLRGTDAEGIFFCLFMGLFLLWVLLEFVATRERIAIDLARQVLTRSVRGVFRKQEQVIDLRDIQSIGLEIKRDVRGRRRQYLYLYGSREKFLVNSPAKVYLEHRKLGKLLAEATRIQGLTEGNYRPQENEPRRNEHTRVEEHEEGKREIQWLFFFTSCWSSW